MDLKMKPYRVMSIKDNIGYLEVVKQSDTVESIHKKYGGSAGAFDKNTIKKYLEANNKEVELELAFENFRRSVAGYVITTYILGIGDRHTGNYMVYFWEVKNLGFKKRVFFPYRFWAHYGRLQKKVRVES